MFKFMIRDVLWLTMVAAVLVGWAVDNRAKRRTIAFLENDPPHVSQLPPMPLHIWIKYQLGLLDEGPDAE